MAHTIWYAFHCSRGALVLPTCSQVHQALPFSHTEAIGLSQIVLPRRMSMRKFVGKTQQA